MSPRLSDRLLRSQADERLAALAADGHEEAFAALVDRHRGPLLALARGLGAGARAEDVVQQALMQAWLALQSGTEVEHVRGWLYQATRRAAWRAVAAPVADELSPVLTAAADTESEVERMLETRSVLAELQRLPHRQRDALVQTVLEGRAGPEVANELGLTDNAFRQLVFRARTALRAAAGALVPLPLLAWAARRPSSAPMNERVAQLLSSGGTAGSAAGLMKFAVVVAAAGTIAGGVAAGHALDGTPSQGPARTSERGSTSRHPSSVQVVRASPRPTSRRPGTARHAEPRAQSPGGGSAVGAGPTRSLTGSAGGGTPSRQRSVAATGEPARDGQHADGSAPALGRSPGPPEQAFPESDGEPSDPTSTGDPSSSREPAQESGDTASPRQSGEDD